jgi:hypothetical protein|tara:strand:- start:214 stop:423 length:210 start_codon:yes stop_codon:yes gene_type:complete
MVSRILLNGLTIKDLLMSQNKKQNKTKNKVTTQSSSEAQAIYAMIQMEKQRKANKPPAAWPNNNRDGLD